MASRHVRELLARRREEELPPGDEETLRTHLSECSECRACDLLLTRNDRLIGAQAPAVALPARHPPMPARTTSQRVWLPIAATAVVTILALAVGVALGNWRASVAAPSLAPHGTPSASFTPATVPPTTPAATPTPRPSPSARIVAFPDLPVIIGTSTGDLYFQLVDGRIAGRRVHACDGAVRNLVAAGRQALFVCGDGAAASLYLYDDSTGAVSTIVRRTDGSLATFTGDGEVLYVQMGVSVPPAPIPMTKLMLRDLRTGATTQIDERFGVAFDLRLTGEGAAVWRPQNSLSFRRPEAEAGTWVLRGTTLIKLSLHRLVDAVNGTDILESEPVDQGGFLSSSGCCTYVLGRTGTAERRLTPPEVANEKAVAVRSDGRLIAWRPMDGTSDGTMIVYNAGAVERQNRGLFSTFRLMRSGDWVIGTDFSAPGQTFLRGYRMSDGSFAVLPCADCSAVALLGSR